MWSRSSGSTCRATTRSTGACRTSASPASRDSAKRATRPSSTTTRRFRSSTTSRGSSASMPTSSAARCVTSSTIRSAASSRAAGSPSTDATRRTRCCPRPQRGGAAMADFLLGHVQPRRRAGRGAHRQLPLELLRALLPGQLEADEHGDRQLRPALGVRPAVLRHERRDRQHRLPLGQLCRAGLRARRHGRSV